MSIQTQHIFQKRKNNSLKLCMVIGWLHFFFPSIVVFTDYSATLKAAWLCNLGDVHQMVPKVVTATEFLVQEVVKKMSGAHICKVKEPGESTVKQSLTHGTRFLFGFNFLSYTKCHGCKCDSCFSACFLPTKIMHLLNSGYTFAFVDLKKTWVQRWCASLLLVWLHLHLQSSLISALSTFL